MGNNFNRGLIKRMSFILQPVWWATQDPSTRLVPNSSYPCLPSSRLTWNYQGIYSNNDTSCAQTCHLQIKISPRGNRSFVASGRNTHLFPKFNIKRETQQHSPRLSGTYYHLTTRPDNAVVIFSLWDMCLQSKWSTIRLRSDELKNDV